EGLYPVVMACIRARSYVAVIQPAIGPWSHDPDGGDEPLLLLRAHGALCQLQSAGAAMNAATNLFLGQERKPAFDLIQPRGARRCDGHVIARPLRQPAPDEGRLVRRVVVEDQVH